ncbi:hypothetical protein SAMN02745673_04947 [Marinactinospora thermotolerans DSM 45154]|uniref:Phosphotransferase enzyme family protein n=1 Tax=Marinactinospora thermotolerans DSM 45154 TaxID=1122192 RepID=A0A1T4TFN3_9ACTN|nr:protein kinase [Marinactinospora thermotolerans]SKA39244.1 hypothetical protein SAMN02745673_04947 [Marinactinospora thermotolerans DSM 45154]
MRQIENLIRPHTGHITRTRVVTGGYGTATTFTVTAERGTWFVKATPNRPGGHLDAARREAAVGPFVTTVSPEIRFTVEDPDWFVVGFEHIDARPADFTPGSPDLPLLVDVLDRLAAIPLPPVAHDWHETRWDRFATEEERALFRGDDLVHADVHGRNVLIDGDGRSRLVDWEWPTRGAGLITLGSVAVQLVAAGHSAESAESWIGRCSAWQRADPDGLDAFARAGSRMMDWFANRHPEDTWLSALADAASTWSHHRARALR